MEPKIINRNSFQVMGLLTRITPEDENIEIYGLIWKEFESYRHQIMPNSTDQAYYGVSFSTGEEGINDYLAGMAVRDVPAIPDGLVVREIPAARYAVFECPVPKIGETYQMIFREWLLHSQYELSSLAPAYEQYPPEGDSESPVLIYIPLVDKRSESD